MNIDVVRTFEEPKPSAATEGRGVLGDGFDRALTSSLDSSPGSSRKDSASSRTSVDAQNMKSGREKESSGDRSESSSESKGRKDPGVVPKNEAKTEAGESGTSADTGQAAASSENEEKESLDPEAQEGRSRETADADSEIRGDSEASVEESAEEFAAEQGAPANLPDSSAGEVPLLSSRQAEESVAREEFEASIALDPNDEVDSGSVARDAGAQVAAEPGVARGNPPPASAQDAVAASAASKTASEESRVDPRTDRRAEEGAIPSRSEASNSGVEIGARVPAAGVGQDGLGDRESQTDRERSGRDPESLDSAREVDPNPREEAGLAGTIEGMSLASVAQQAGAAAEVQQGAAAIDPATLNPGPQQAVPVNPVLSAGVVAPGTPVPPPAPDALAIQAEWLAARGGGSARLILHPPELGEIAVRVSLRGGAVHVVMVAHEASARALAEGQVERLAEAFSNRDLRLENFEVRRGDPASIDEDGQNGFSEADAREERESRERAASAAAKARDAGRAGTRADGRPRDPQQDLPRIVTIAAASGVDLRI